MVLPTNIDASYADDGGDASVQLHQEHHDVLHVSYNSIEETRLESAYLMADHVVVNLLKGTYTPGSDKLIVEVSFAGRLSGVAHASTFFVWNQDAAAGTDLLTGVGFAGGAFIEDTEYITVGPVSSPGATGRMTRRFVIDVTADTEMTWEFVIAGTGYYEEFSPGDIPAGIDITPDNNYVFVTTYSSDRVSVYKAGNRWSRDGITTLVDEWTVNGAFGVAIHPTDNDIVYVASFDDGEIYEMSVPDGTVLRTFNTGGGPQHIVVSTDGTKLFAAMGTNIIKPVTLSTGSVGSDITVGGLGGTLGLTAVGDYILVACNGGDRVDRVDVDTYSISSLATNAPVDTAAAQPDSSTFWVLARSGSRAFEVDLDTMTATAEPTFTVSSISGTPNVIAVSPSGKSIVIGSSSHNLQTFAVPSKDVRFEFQEGTGSHIIIDDYGDLWILNQDDDSFHHFHCCSLEIDPDDDFWGGYASVVLETR